MERTCTRRRSSRASSRRSRGPDRRHLHDGDCRAIAASHQRPPRVHHRGGRGGGGHVRVAALEVPRDLPADAGLLLRAAQRAALRRGRPGRRRAESLRGRCVRYVPRGPHVPAGEGQGTGRQAHCWCALRRGREQAQGIELPHAGGGALGAPAHQGVVPVAHSCGAPAASRSAGGVREALELPEVLRGQRARRLLAHALIHACSVRQAAAQRSSLARGGVSGGGSAHSLVREAGGSGNGGGSARRVRRRSAAAIRAGREGGTGKVKQWRSVLARL
ncbi:unnamed protein product [Prorocentrum cordatum]|uniref:Uncharacterized protein n=1 Tax=Prorocentrum cordatum TaxID=2364126 RepID=A0ABN9WNL4_9DINO|nr:unnamed protein product [Polarella glacialis]